MQLSFSSCPKCSKGILKYVPKRILDLDMGTMINEKTFACNTCSYEDSIIRCEEVLV